jgi:hypothetical protein
VADLVQSNKGMDCNIYLKAHSFNSDLDFFPENLGVAMITDRGSSGNFHDGKVSKGSEFSVCWLINAAHVEETFHKENIAESHPILRFMLCIHSLCRSQWPRGLRRRSTAPRLLRSYVRIPRGAWMFVCCVCCVLSGRGLCDKLISRPKKSYRLWCVVLCDQETS